MAQSRCLFVGQALQLPHRDGLCQSVLRLVKALGDTDVPRHAADALSQIYVCLDTAQSSYLVIGCLAQPDDAADGDADIPVARCLAAPGRAIDYAISHNRVVVIDQLRASDMLYPQLGVRAFARAAGAEEQVALAPATYHGGMDVQRVLSRCRQVIHHL